MRALLIVLAQPSITAAFFSRRRWVGVFVVVLDRKDGDVIGLVTLHELLRAESAMAQQAKQEQ